MTEVCKCCPTSHRQRDEIDRLIAINAELLAVARMAEWAAKLEIGMERAPDFSPDDMLRAAEAAIAKATGEPAKGLVGGAG